MFLPELSLPPVVHRSCSKLHLLRENSFVGESVLSVLFVSVPFWCLFSFELSVLQFLSRFSQKIYSGLSFEFWKRKRDGQKGG